MDASPGPLTGGAHLGPGRAGGGQEPPAQGPLNGERQGAEDKRKSAFQGGGVPSPTPSCPVRGAGETVNEIRHAQPSGGFRPNRRQMLGVQSQKHLSQGRARGVLGPCPGSHRAEVRGGRATAQHGAGVMCKGPKGESRGRPGRGDGGRGTRGQNRRNRACYPDAPGERRRERGGWDSRTCVWGSLYGAQAQPRPRGAGEGGALPPAPMAPSGGGEGVHAEMEAGLEGGRDGEE